MCISITAFSDVKVHRKIFCLSQKVNLLEIGPRVQEVNDKFPFLLVLQVSWKLTGKRRWSPSKSSRTTQVGRLKMISWGKSKSWALSDKKTYCPSSELCLKVCLLLYLLDTACRMFSFYLYLNNAILFYLFVNSIYT